MTASRGCLKTPPGERTEGLLIWKSSCRCGDVVPRKDLLFEMLDGAQTRYAGAAVGWGVAVTRAWEAW